MQHTDTFGCDQSLPVLQNLFIKPAETTKSWSFFLHFFFHLWSYAYVQLLTKLGIFFNRAESESLFNHILKEPLINS